MRRASPIMAKNHEGEQELKSDGRHDEEVYGDQVLGVVFEKGSPRLGGRFPVPDHVLGDGCLRYLDSNLQQFAVDARRTPARVGEAHLTDQIANFRRYRWATFSTPTLPCPIEAKSLPMPGDNALRLDNEQCRSPIIQKSESQTHRTRSAQPRRSL